jgi:large conductance mechanosensitive channel
MKFFQEFREFISRGNVIDLAVGIVVGTAFTAIVNSLVEDLLTPILGILLGGVNFEGLMWQFGEAEIRYGSFIQSIISFLIISFAVFTLVRIINALHRRPEKVEAPPPPAEDIVLLTEIRDLLKSRPQI